ncbi:MAG: type I-B CRISPR-associated protein Cas7/Csh2 [Promethearchaeota archaeon]
MSEKIQNNSEVLFIYDAKMCNPNGDPDDENKPRMDYDRNLNIVSDVRLKRFIRDYLVDYENKDIFVRKMDDKTVDATKRLKLLIDQNKEVILRNNDLKDLLKKDKDSYEPQEKNLSNHLDWLLSKLIDIRFFGATMPIKSEAGKGSSITFTGPIQFNWGYSLNKITGVLDSNTITSTFGGATEEQSTMGKDYRVAYSIIAFHGIVSSKRAKKTNLSTTDINLLDKSIVRCIPLEATTRSKEGQEPLFYMRLKYKSDDYFIGDFRKYLKLANESNQTITFDNSDKLYRGKYKIDLSDLADKLKDKKNHISKIYFWKNDDIKLKGWNITGDDTNKYLTIDDKNKIPAEIVKINNDEKGKQHNE